MDTTALESENAALRRQLAEMEDAVRQAEADSAENARLRELLNLREQRRDITGDLEAALITEHTVTNWTSALTLNKGSQHGVEVNDCVIDETGAMVGTRHGRASMTTRRWRIPTCQATTFITRNLVQAPPR